MNPVCRGCAYVLWKTLGNPVENFIAAFRNFRFGVLGHPEVDAIDPFESFVFASDFPILRKIIFNLMNTLHIKVAIEILITEFQVLRIQRYGLGVFRLKAKWEN